MLFQIAAGRKFLLSHTNQIFRPVILKIFCSLKAQWFKICFVRKFGFYAVRVDWRRKVLDAGQYQDPHEIKVHDIFN